MAKYIVIGHWLSANLGDKYQPYVIYKSLIENGISSEQIDLINFSSDGGNPMSFEFDGIKYNIMGPEEINITGVFRWPCTICSHPHHGYYWHLKKVTAPIRCSGKPELKT